MLCDLAGQIDLLPAQFGLQARERSNLERRGRHDDLHRPGQNPPLVDRPFLFDALAAIDQFVELGTRSPSASRT